MKKVSPDLYSLPIALLRKFPWPIFPQVLYKGGLELLWGLCFPHQKRG